jgi:hypothetical protein
VCVVYAFQKWSIAEDRCLRSTRLAIRETIERLGCILIDGTAVTIPASDLNADGMTEPGYVRFA